jgi:uncharacterized PurR-regulated membrane protein YhhQ (DUF165 family)
VDNKYLNPLGFVALSLAAQLGCLALLKLSQFGQDPFPTLPLAVIMMFGALFVSPLYSLARRMPVPTLGASLVAAALLNTALATLLTRVSEASSFYLLAPTTALALSLGYQFLFKERGAMAAAMTVYVVCTLLANYTFDSFLPLGFFLVNVGTLFFGITFTQRDRVHRFGRRNVYLMIFLAAGANVAMALTLGTPLRYVAVGFVAIILSETADTEVYQRFLERRWLTRVAASNAVSAPMDTIIFTVLAFAGEPFATPQWMFQVILTDMIVKYASGMMAALGIMRQQNAGALRPS